MIFCSVDSGSCHLSQEMQEQKLFFRKIVDWFSDLLESLRCLWLMISCVIRSVWSSKVWVGDNRFGHYQQVQWQHSILLPGQSQGRRSLVDCRLWGRTESDITEVTQQQQQQVQITRERAKDSTLRNTTFQRMLFFSPSLTVTIIVIVSQNCRHCFIVTVVDRKCSNLLKAAYLTHSGTFFNPLDYRAKFLEALTERVFYVQQLLQFC